MECDVELQARGTSEGSLVVDAFLQFAGDTSEFFTKLDTYLEFAKLFGQEYFNQAVQYFNAIENTQHSLNEYFSKRPLDLAIATACIAKLFLILKKIGKGKKLSTDEEIIIALKEEVSERIARELMILIKKKSIYRAILPVIEDVAKSIEIDNQWSFWKSLLPRFGVQNNRASPRESPQNGPSTNHSDRLAEIVPPKP